MEFEAEFNSINYSKCIIYDGDLEVANFQAKNLYEVEDFLEAHRITYLVGRKELQIKFRGNFYHYKIVNYLIGGELVQKLIFISSINFKKFLNLNGHLIKNVIY